MFDGGTDGEARGQEVKAFYDTNVLLDVILRREPFYADSARVWTLAEMGRIEGYASAVSFSNIFYIVERLRNRQAATAAVRTLLHIFTPAACDAQVLGQAVDAELPDFEDAIQYDSALHADMDCILTRNPDDYPRPPAVPVLSPSEFLAQLELR